MKQSAFLRCFLTQERVLVDSTGIIDSCPGCGRPHTAHPIANVSKVQDLTLIFIDQCIWLINSSSSVKKSILSNHFATIFYSLTTI